MVRRSQRGTRARRVEAGTTGWRAGDAGPEASVAAACDWDVPEMSGPGELGGAWLMLMNAPLGESRGVGETRLGAVTSCPAQRRADQG